MVGAVLLTACGAGTPDPAPGAQADGAAVVTPAGTGETAEATGTGEKWNAVRLDEMAIDRADPDSERRNPFRFGAAPSSVVVSAPVGDDEPGPAVAPVRRVPDSDTTQPGAASQGGMGDVPLTFIGFVESPGIEGRIVVLTDGEMVFHGRVGDVIDGRYRIVGVGLESVDVERIDRRGRQTLRLSSS